MSKEEIGKRKVEVHKMEGLYPCVRLEDFMKVCKGLEEENRRLKATVDAYAKQVSRLEQRLLKYEKVHDGKFIEKDITTSESKPLFNN